MGMIQCKKHGFTGFMIGLDTELSRSIYNKLFDEDIIKIHVIYKFDEYPYAEENDKIGDYERFYYIAITKFYKKALKKEYLVYSEEDEIQLKHILEDIDSGGICGKCFNEYVAKNAIKILK